MSSRAGAASLADTADALSKLAAAAGAFLIICGLAEHPQIRRLALEFALIAPYAATFLRSCVLSRLPKGRRLAPSSTNDAPQAMSDERSRIILASCLTEGGGLCLHPLEKIR
jgi:hypothetical protein